MTPPIRDGSGSSIGSIRLGDGSEIAEVRTGAEDVLFSAISDSVVSQYDATQEGTGTLSTITDQIGNNDLTGSTDVVSSGINGLQTFDFDSSQSVDISTTFASSDPFAIVAVIKPDTVAQNTTYFDGFTSDNFAFFDNNKSAGAVIVNRGGNGARASSTPLSTNAQIITLEALNGNDIRLEIDDSQQLQSTTTSSNLNGLTLAERGDGANPAEIRVGQVEILQGHTPAELQSRQDSLRQKWGTP